MPQRRWTWLSRELSQLGHEVYAIVPPPHNEREISFRNWLESMKPRKTKPQEVGPSGEKIFRTMYFPAGRSVTQRVLNQAAVGLGAILTVVRRPKWLRELSPDLIIATVPALPTAIVAYAASRILKIPYHIDLRDAWPDLLDQSNEWNRATGRKSFRERLLLKGPFQVLSAITRSSVNFSLRHAESIIVTSEYLENSLRTRTELSTNGAPPQVLTIRNLFPPETPVTAELRNPVARSDGPLRVLYAGTLGRAQNLMNVLDAYEIAQSMGVGIQLRMIGAGASREALTSRIKKRGLDIVIEGRKPASELRDDYAWADTALVHLTDWAPLQRAVPSKTYELMSSGIHISGVIKGEAADLIQNLNAGHVVPPESPKELAQLWQKLADDRSLLDISSQGSEWVLEQSQTAVPDALTQVVLGRRK
ncbi:glycosyltransferase family 4 protein [Corynebacterium casei]|uniref:glycosyltransferase family 4 protein n=1 Tax=Corynebacterium casei TaxID=160386 RepID=UPI003FD1EF6F